jgi:Thiolase, N-terminal domain
MSATGLFGLTKLLAKEAAFPLKRAGLLGDGIALTVKRGRPWLHRHRDLATVPEKVLDGIRAQVPSRSDQDALAVESHRRAAAAIEAGYFAEQIVPVEVATRKGIVQFATDEPVRPGVKVEDLARLRPAFAAGGTVTAGNASGVNDAAAAVMH